ncbi:hypothetical protein YQE_01346, partial [Dendroctonus ponderosae]
MSFFNNIKKVLHFGGNDAKKKKVYNNVKMETDPEEYWDMIGELGDGAYGKVYKAQHRQSGMLAAAKMCRLDGEDDLADFMIEIDILTEIKHPNIVELLEAFQKEQQLWLLIEYCDGGALDSIMTELEKPLTELQIAYVCQNMCKGLQFLHKSHVIHRDVKAGNVLLTMAGGVKIADFGVSAKNKSTLQKHDTFIGTPYWMAPEVVLCETFRDNPYDFKVDIWSMGITLIEFAQMEPPNHEMSPMRVLLKIQKSDPPRLEQPSKWSKDFNDFIAKSLIKDPQKRPNCEDLLRHPFVNRTLDVKPLTELLLEYRAEVVEEELTDDDPEVTYHKNDRTSQVPLDIEEDSTSVQSHDVDAKGMELPVVVVKVGSGTTPEDSMNFVIVSTPQSERNKNTSTITINSDLPDQSNSLASNISQVTVVTTHPPIIIDNSHMMSRTSSASPSNHSSGEVVIVANETNKTQIESSDEEFCPSLDSLEYPPPSEFRDKPIKGKKLDESEVLITDSSYVINDSGLDVSEANSRLLDTSHVSVVKIDEEKVQVKDSTSYIDKSGAETFRSSTSDLSNSSSGKLGSTKSDYGDELRGKLLLEAKPSGCFITFFKGTSIILDSYKMNGRIVYSSSAEDTSKRNPLNGKAYVDNYESATSDRSHSDCGSVRSTDSHHRRPVSVSKSDVESISIASHESRGSNGKDSGKLVHTLGILFGILFSNFSVKNDDEIEDHAVILRKPPKTASQTAAILNRKTRKRTRKFMIDGVMITTTTSKGRLKTGTEVIKGNSWKSRQVDGAEVDLLPKEKRKHEFKLRKDKMDADHSERERTFLEKLNENHESSLRRLSDSLREKIALMERQFLQQKQQLTSGKEHTLCLGCRTREAALWEVEERHIHEKHQLMKRQIKDIFILQRHQMLTRHEKEKEQIKRRAVRKEEELLKKQTTEKRNLPKRIRTEMKAREAMFRESMRISISGASDPEIEKNKFKDFQEKEKKRYQAEQQKFELKHQKQLEEL